VKKSIGPRTAIYPTPVLVVGTYDHAGKPNVMTAAWGGVCCSNPPCVTVSLRKATYTYDCILDRKAFTISIPSESYVKHADYFGMVSGRNEDKFARSGLTPVKSEIVDAPYVGEFPIVLECNLLCSQELGMHTQFIGEVIDTKVDEDSMGEEGLPDIQKIKAVLFIPDERAYYRVGDKLGNAFSIGKEISR